VADLDTIWEGEEVCPMLQVSDSGNEIDLEPNALIEGKDPASFPLGRTTSSESRSFARHQLHETLSQQLDAVEEWADASVLVTPRTGPDFDPAFDAEGVAMNPIRLMPSDNVNMDALAAEFHDLNSLPGAVNMSFRSATSFRSVSSIGSINANMTSCIPNAVRGRASSISKYIAGDLA